MTPQEVEILRRAKAQGKTPRIVCDFGGYGKELRKVVQGPDEHGQITVSGRRDMFITNVRFCKLVSA